MIVIPEFSENSEKSMLLYFNADNKDVKALCDDIEKTYVCFTKMTQTLKDGHKYVVLEVADEA